MEKQILIQENELKKSNYQYFVIVADIGGSNAYFAVMGVKSKKEFEIILKNTISSDEIKDMNKVINDILFQAKELYDIEINRCCIGAAGPVSRRRGHIDLTNLDLRINSKDILEGTMLNKVILVNDFEAIGYGLDLLNLEKDCIKLNHIGKDLTGGWSEGNAFAVIGAGAGLGMSVVSYNQISHMHMPLPSEGGHIDFSPQDSFELELAEFLREKAHQSKDIHPEFERVLSGKGMENIFDFLRSRKDCKETDVIKQIDLLKGDQKLRTIDSNYDKDETCKKAIDMFITFYARAARTLALISECYSGLFITGRIAQKHIDKIKNKNFMIEFEKHGKKNDVLQKIPIYVITNKDVGLYGCCNVAANFYNLGGV